MNIKSLLSGILACIAFLSFGWSKDGEVSWRKLDESIVTPHRPIAKTTTGTKPTAMIFACGVSQREIIELKQRFDYNYKLWPVLNLKNFSPFTLAHNDNKKIRAPYASIMRNEDYQIEEKKLLEEMEQCDLIVLGKFSFNAFPTHIRNKILQLVKQGKGLIIIPNDGSDMTLENVSFQKTDIDFNFKAIPSLAEANIKIGTLGKGKILVINYPEIKVKIGTIGRVGAFSPYESEDPLYYDYIMAFMGKCFWHMTAPERSIIKNVSPDGKVELKKTAPNNSKFTYAVLDKFGREIFKGTQKAEKNISIPLPELPVTAKLLEVKLISSDNKTIDYEIAPLNIKKSVILKNITLPKDGWKIDEVISGKIEFTAPAKGVIKLSAVDNSGREIYRSNYAFSGRKSLDFTAKILHQKSSFANLSAQFIQDGKLIDEIRTPIYFDTTRDTSDFIFGIWSYANSNTRTANLLLKQMAAHGIDVVMDAHALYASEERSHFIPRNLKRAGLNYAAYSIRLVGSHIIRHRKKCGYRYYEMMQQNNGSPFDKDGRPLDREYLTTRIARGAKNIGVMFYNLGDENTGADVLEDENCFCDDCQRRFREYLKREHGTIENLNKNYGSKYKSFNEIKVYPFIKSVENGKYCEWVDYRLFMEEEFIKLHLFYKTKIRSVDPEARVGIEGMAGTARTFGSFNLAKMIPHFEFCCPYFVQRDAWAVVQYMKGSKNIPPLRGAWFGSYEGEMNDQYIQQQPWRYLFAGMGSIFYWTSGVPATASTYSNACIFGPDLKLLSHFTKASDEVKIIKEKAIGKMLLNSTPRYDDILIHYSNSNLHVATLNPDKSTWDASLADFQGILSSLGLGYRYIDQQNLEKGVPAGTKVLMLPYSQAMSEKEAASVREFVKQGGMVIADYNPATANKYGRFYSESALKDVFGKFEKMNIARYGKGYAVYLDDYLSGSYARSMKGEAAGIQKGLLHIFKKAGVVPSYSVVDDKGTSREFSVFENEKTTSLCILAPRTAAGAARQSAVGAEGAAVKTAVDGSLFRTVILKKPMHVYDIVKDKYLGYVKSFNVDLAPAVGRIFVCLEKTAMKPEIKVDKFSASFSKGEAVQFKIGNFENAAILTVKDPSDRIIDVQRLTGNTARFVPAFNEPSGKWTAELKNAVGGIKTSITFNVK